MPPNLVIAWLRQNWFVAALPVSVALAWVMPQAGATGGWLRAEVTAKIGVAAIFLFQGMTLDAHALHAGARQWRLHTVVQGFTFIGFPLLGFALNWLAGAWLAPDLRLGFMYLCVLPSTISSSVILTAMAGGNTAGAIFNAVLSSLIGVVATPLWIAWLMKSSGRPIAFGPVVLELIMLLVAPLVVGQILRQPLRTWIDARKRVLGNISSGIILFIVFSAFCNSVQSGVWSLHGPALLGAATIGTLVVFALAMIAVAWIAGATRLGRGDRIAALFCGPQKTLASGVPMAKLIFGAHPALGVILLPMMLYHPLQLLVHGLMAARYARGAGLATAGERREAGG